MLGHCLLYLQIGGVVMVKNSNSNLLMFPLAMVFGVFLDQDSLLIFHMKKKVQGKQLQQA
jgi:hypothetical protein